MRDNVEVSEVACRGPCGEPCEGHAGGHVGGHIRGPCSGLEGGGMKGQVESGAKQHKEVTRITEDAMWEGPCGRPCGWQYGSI